MDHRTFISEDQNRFAQFSGDYNPLHVDAVAARRSLFGSPVVHGVHALLWALDRALARIPGPAAVRSLNVSFFKPIRVGERVSCSVTQINGDSLAMELLIGNGIVSRVEAILNRGGFGNVDCFHPGFPPKMEPYILEKDKIGKRSGVLELYLDRKEAAGMFPDLARSFSLAQFSVILGTTRLVGMECPGMHSMYSALSLTAQSSGKASGLNYEVTKFDQRFGLTVMKISAPGMTGAINAFLRPEPERQESYPISKTLVAGDEFAGQRALVIGGSRGLGEVSVKLLAAGGASVKFTYHQGAQDARRVVSEIRAGGGDAESFSLDVLNEQGTLNEVLGGEWNLTHLYYFATPFIVIGNKTFSAPLFQKFCDYYVTGFQRIIERLKLADVKGVFYPSSVFVEELPPGSAEYVAAKMAGETMCSFMEKLHKHIVFYKPRLPRMATDQAASIMPVNVAKPAPIMLEHLRTFKGISVSRRVGSKQEETVVLPGNG